jgi:hypothetical protein
MPGRRVLRLGCVAIKVADERDRPLGFVDLQVNEATLPCELECEKREEAAE